MIGRATNGWKRKLLDIAAVHQAVRLRPLDSINGVSQMCFQVADDLSSVSLSPQIAAKQYINQVEKPDITSGIGSRFHTIRVVQSFFG